MEVLLKLPNSDSMQKEEEETVYDFRNRSSSGSKRSSSMEKNDIELRSTKSEMMEMKEENERLKAMLEEIETDYKSLKIRFSDAIHHRSDDLKNPIEIIQKLDELFDRERDLVSLSLGRGGSSSPTNGKKGDEKIGRSRDEKDELAMAGLTLGLGEHDHAGLISLEGKKEEKEEVGNEEERLMKERKVEKRMMGDGEEVGNQQSHVHVKRARVCVRARCDTPTMNDGCQWRKYGQKISKGNSCPRAYYRCTVASGCPVRKQVQRCIDDMSILITTYEGSHNHPLPISATAMASTTAAAASMLLTGSSSASSQSIPAAIAGTTDNRSSKFNLYNNPPFNFSPATTTTTLSPLHQTVTLDLTAPSQLSSSKTTSIDFSKFSTVGSIQRSFPSTSFDFSSSAIDSGHSDWGMGNSKQSNLFPYGQLRFGSSLFLEKQAVQDDQSFTETLIKTIASDPSFRSAIATAINSAKVGSRNGEDEAAAQPNRSHYLPFSVPRNSSSSPPCFTQKQEKS